MSARSSKAMNYIQQLQRLIKGDVIQNKTVNGDYGAHSYHLSGLILSGQQSITYYIGI